MAEKRFRAFELADFQVRKVNGATQIEGHAAVFNTLSSPLFELGGARERIEPGAFRRAIEEDDVRLLINHDPNLVLARNKSGTLHLEEDEKGLAFRAKLPDTQPARDLVTLVKRGDISQNSFGFIPIDSDWETQNAEQVHVVKLARLFDVSVVTFPAYEETFSKVRSLTQALTKKELTEQDRETIRGFLGALESLALNRDEGQTRDIEGGGPPEGSGTDHDGAEVDLVAREIRRREIELFELEA